MAAAQIMSTPTVYESTTYPVESAQFSAPLSPSRKRKYLSTKSVPDMVRDMACNVPEKTMFEPVKHLNYQPPKKIWTMKEIGKEFEGLSPNAVSEPFSFFTEEAVQHMRSEILSKPVLENCMYSSNLSPCQLRGFVPRYAPFIYDAWHNPEVLSIVSKIAGIDLIPEMDFEIAHINISINSEEEQERAAAAIAEHNNREADEGVSGCPWEDDAPAVDWHTDSYPFVCVLMLSDCSKMIGGETALRTGTGEIMKVRGPSMGNAVILQGRYIEHQALRTFGGKERITMVTSFRPRSAMVKDDTVLTTVRAISDLSELYHQYSEYRLEMLEERIRDQLKKMRDRQRAHRRFDTAGVKAFLNEQKSFLESMMYQMVDDDKVIPGFTDSTHLLSEDIRERYQKKAKLYIDDKEKGNASTENSEG